MSLTRIIQLSIVTVYFTITFFGVLLEFLNIRPPILEPLVVFATQMMSPYEKYSTFATDILLESRTNTDWIPIPVDRYLPFSSCERQVRVGLFSFNSRGDQYKNMMYHTWASKILLMETQRDSSVNAVRLRLQQWPLSPEGYRHLNTPELTQETLTITKEI